MPLPSSGRTSRACDDDENLCFHCSDIYGDVQPGSREVKVTLDPAEYGLPSGSYYLSFVSAAGTLTQLPAFAWSGPRTFTVSVPEASLQCILLERVP